MGEEGAEEWLQRTHEAQRSEHKQSIDLRTHQVAFPQPNVALPVLALPDQLK